MRFPGYSLFLLFALIAPSQLLLTARICRVDAVYFYVARFTKHLKVFNPQIMLITAIPWFPIRVIHALVVHGEALVATTELTMSNNSTQGSRDALPARWVAYDLPSHYAALHSAMDSSTSLAYATGSLESPVGAYLGRIWPGVVSPALTYKGPEISL